MQFIPENNENEDCLTHATHATMMNTAPRISRWALLLGGIGFAAGFLGPIELNPDANQGPLLGIFITGPGGALAGVVLGLLFKWLPIDATVKWLALITSCIVGFFSVLYFCLPEPKVLGLVIDGQITNCTAPAQHIDQAIGYWNKRIADAPWGKPRDGWKQDTKRMLEDDGAIIEITATRETHILENRKPWNHGKLSLTAWNRPNENHSYFANFDGSDCSHYQGNVGPLYVVTGQGSSGWPPTDLPSFLDLGKR